MTKRPEPRGALSAAVALLIVVGLATAGCSPSGRPSLGSVKGRVTLDGRPLANAVVMFKPEGLRSSRGLTNAQGDYELAYLRDIRGAAVGKHRVVIARMPQPDGSRPQKLPAKYNVETELVAEVEGGSNEFNWSLKSE